MAKELAKTYDPSQIEGKLYERWEEKKYLKSLDHTGSVTLEHTGTGLNQTMIQTLPNLLK